MVHEINVLAKALIKNEKKLVKSQDTYKVKAKEMKKIVRGYEKDIKILEGELFQATEQVKGLRSNEDHILCDLVKQQKIAKDSLRALENLSDKYDREKRELIVRLEREKEEAIRREEQRLEMKVQQLKSLNDQLSSKLGTLHETEDDFSALQKNYNEAIGIIEDQKREL